MAKVEGSNPFIRFERISGDPGGSVVSRIAVRSASGHGQQLCCFY